MSPGRRSNFYSLPSSRMKHQSYLFHQRLTPFLELLALMKGGNHFSFASRQTRNCVWKYFISCLNFALNTIPVTRVSDVLNGGRPYLTSPLVPMFITVVTAMSNTISETVTRVFFKIQICTIAQWVNIKF